MVKPFSEGESKSISKVDEWRELFKRRDGERKSTVRVGFICRENKEEKREKRQAMTVISRVCQKPGIGGYSRASMATTVAETSSMGLWILKCPFPVVRQDTHWREKDSNSLKKPLTQMCLAYKMCRDK